MRSSQPDNNLQSPPSSSSYIIPATTTGNDTPILCDIKLICTQRKKVFNLTKTFRFEIF